MKSSRIALLCLFCSLFYSETWANTTTNSPSTTKLPPVHEPYLTEVILGELALSEQNPGLARDYYLKLAAQTKNPAIARRAVHLAIATEAPLQGIPSAIIWADQQPSDLSAQQITANLLINANQVTQAQPYIERLILADTTSTGDLERFIASLDSLDDATSKQLLQLMGQFADRYQKNPEALYNIALFYQEEKQNEAALAIIDKALAQKPHWADAVELRTQVIAQQDSNEKALFYLRSHLKQYPQNPQLALLEAQLLMDSQQTAAAEKAYTKLIQDKTVGGFALLNLSQMAIKANQLDKAKQYLTQASTISDSKDAAAFLLGDIENHQEHLKAAINWYTSVGSGPYYLSAQLKAAILLAENNGIDAARSQLHNIDVNTYDEVRQVFVVESELLLGANQPEEALKVLGNALRIVPNNIQLLYLQGLIAEKLQQYDLLQQNLKTILSIDPNQINALNALGFFLADHTHRYQEALGYLNRALTLQPNNASILDSMGWLQYRMGNDKVALDYLQRAYKLAPDVDTAGHLGAVLWRTGDKEKATELWDTAVKQEPDNSALQALISDIKASK